MSREGTQFLDESDVREATNAFEQFRNLLNTDDNFLAAILHNTAVMGKMMSGGVGVSGINRENLPIGQAGIAINEIDEGDSGRAVFFTDGDRFVSVVTPSQPVEENSVVEVIAENNEVVPRDNAKKSDLIGGGRSEPIPKADFVFADTGEQNVTIDPGETKDVLVVDSKITRPYGLQLVGTNDETYSKYQYKVDGNELLDNPLPKPLGLYNDMFRFPEPLRVTDSFTVVVTRESGASGSADYFSNAVLQ